jgi:hypothetical protein
MPRQRGIVDGSTEGPNANRLNSLTLSGPAQAGIEVAIAARTEAIIWNSTRFYWRFH